MKDMCRSTSTVAELWEVRAVPWDPVQLILLRIQVVGCSLREPCYQRLRLRAQFPLTYLVVSDDCVHIHQLRVRDIARLGVMRSVHMRCVAVIICVPWEMRRCDRRVIDAARRRYSAGVACDKSDQRAEDWNLQQPRQIRVHGRQEHREGQRHLMRHFIRPDGRTCVVLPFAEWSAVDEMSRSIKNGRPRRELTAVRRSENAALNGHVPKRVFEQPPLVVVLTLA